MFLDAAKENTKKYEKRHEKTSKDTILNNKYVILRLLQKSKSLFLGLLR